MSYAKTTWHLAKCKDCQGTVDVPFLSREDRDGWAAAHEAVTGHTVARWTLQHAFLYQQGVGR